MQVHAHTYCVSCLSADELVKCSGIPDVAGLSDRGVLVHAANILLHSSAADGRSFGAKLADFGACRQSGIAPDDGDEDCSVRGTYTHLAPEIIEGQSCSEVR